MGKVKVSKKESEFIKELLKETSVDNLIKYHVRNALPNTSDLSKRNVSEFAEILINGYEVEETPEEKLAKWYKNLKIVIRPVDVEYVELGVLNTLEILDIRIEGINK